jgi:clan AA aspartic protease
VIAGVVNADLEATLRLTVRGLDGQTRRITAVIDTGSDGFLSLPLAIIEELGLPWKARTGAELADGSETEFDTYRGILIWDRRRVPIDVDASNSAPLVGTALLANFEMKAQFRSGGKVTIKPLRRQRLSN